MPTTKDDLSRQFKLDVDASGAVTIRETGKPNTSGSLPVFSTDTIDEAYRLRDRLCYLARDGRTFVLHDLPRTVDDLGDVSDGFRREWRPAQKFELARALQALAAHTDAIEHIAHGLIARDNRTAEDAEIRSEGFRVRAAVAELRAVIRWAGRLDVRHPAKESA
jgi:hypothetical protein